jgi:hypothetical protein
MVGLFFLNGYSFSFVLSLMRNTVYLSLNLNGLRFVHLECDRSKATWLQRLIIKGYTVLAGCLVMLPHSLLEPSHHPEQPMLHREAMPNCSSPQPQLSPASLHPSPDIRWVKKPPDHSIPDLLNHPSCVNLPTWGPDILKQRQDTPTVLCLNPPNHDHN